MLLTIVRMRIAEKVDPNLAFNETLQSRVPDILQDLWHAKMRVVRALAKKHKDYLAATFALKRILGRVLSKVRVPH